MFVEEDRINTLKRLVVIVVSNYKMFGKNQDYLCLSVDAMINNKVNSMIEASTNRCNRRDNRNKNMVIDNLIIKRDNCLNNRHVYVFKDDYDESLNDFMHKVRILHGIRFNVFLLLQLSWSRHEFTFLIFYFNLNSVSCCFSCNFSTFFIIFFFTCALVSIFFLYLL